MNGENPVVKMFVLPPIVAPILPKKYALYLTVSFYVSGVLFSQTARAMFRLPL